MRDAGKRLARAFRKVGAGKARLVMQKHGLAGPWSDVVSPRGSVRRTRCP